MVKITPTLGSSGTWQVSAPFDTVVLPTLNYTCTGLRRFSDIVADGKDVYSEFYEPKELPQSRYESDIADEAVIVSLQATSGIVVQLPSTFIMAFPGTGGVPYRGFMLGLDLGAVPKDLELAYLTQRLIDIALDTIGIVVTVDQLVTSEESLVPRQTHQTLETVRKAKITESTTDRAKLIEAEKKISALQVLNKNLEDYIKTHP
jgi:hypothetical protein